MMTYRTTTARNRRTHQAAPVVLPNACGRVAGCITVLRLGNWNVTETRDSGFPASCVVGEGPLIVLMRGLTKREHGKALRP